MHTSSRLVTLKIPLPRRDHRVFLAARRILVRIMGVKAPATIGLIQQNLSGRDARGLADEYLDTVGWPMAGNRTVSLRRRRKVSTAARPARVAVPPRLVVSRQRGILDPTRN
jgi:hypothetical protein